MLEYFTSKMGKKPQVETKERSDSPILSPKDEQFLEHIVSEDRAVSELNTAPEMREAGDAFDNPAQILGPKTRVDDDVETTRGKGHHHSSSQGSKNRWSILDRFNSKKSKSHHDHDHHHSKDKGTVTSKEANREEDDLSAVLEKLNLAADNNKVFSLSKESRELVRKFTLVLQDLVNGVPTAYDDLVHLLDDSQNQLEKSYKHLPPYLQKLIRSLPKKLTTTMGPEILATAAETQGLSSSEASDMKYAAKKTGVRMPSLKDMVTKPGAVAGILRAIMNFLKLRWPAFMGTSVLWSLGIFVLLLVFWYCHKRGRETGLKSSMTTMKMICRSMMPEFKDPRVDVTAIMVIIVITTATVITVIIIAITTPMATVTVTTAVRTVVHRDDRSGSLDRKYEAIARLLHQDDFEDRLFFFLW
ncbi:MAG: RHO1 GDP-GTP exchange protein 2 [Watsoniomyces obsoletus]|nr:MAG: RHO1 GDP-GTP exchange protein 2 [Watsoniomyces obsoletus]